MQRSGLIVVALSAAIWPGVAAAPPPPPALTPEKLEQPVDGYDMRIPFQRWRGWVERQKGPATAALLAEPENLPGERPFGAPLGFSMASDFGVFQSGDVRVYCRPGEPSYQPDRKSCHYRLRRVSVPAPAAVYGGADNPVARWMRDTFDASVLAGHFRRSGLGPDTDWWRTDMERIFAPLPSAVPMLIEQAKVVRVDSRDCPALAAAIRKLEGMRLDRKLDFLGVGEDARLHIPPPHGVTVTYALRTLLPDAGGHMSLEGSGPDMDDLVRPVLAAAETCEAN